MSVSTQLPPVVAEPVRDIQEAVPEAEDFDSISCGRCGWWFPAPEGAAMLFALKGPCPNCGGEFELILGND
jgi:ribosomal protein S27AE